MQVRSLDRMGGTVAHAVDASLQSWSPDQSLGYNEQRALRPGRLHLTLPVAHQSPSTTMLQEPSWSYVEATRSHL
eukprot:358421-Chlamydomonas_euryale.AAC.3